MCGFNPAHVLTLPLGYDAQGGRLQLQVWLSTANVPLRPPPGGIPKNRGCYELAGDTRAESRGYFNCQGREFVPFLLVLYLQGLLLAAKGKVTLKSPVEEWLAR